MNVKIKICGITNKQDALEIAPLGPDLFGFIMYPKSPRFVEERTAKEIVSSLKGRVPAVGVFVNEKPEKVASLSRSCGFDYVQLHGDETPEYVRLLKTEGLQVIKAFRIKDEAVLDEAMKYDADFYMFDAFEKGLYGGTGKAIDDKLLRILFQHRISKEKKIFLSGGLSAENIGGVLSAFKPFAVDASSLLEKSPGKKDIEKVGLFIQKVRRQEQ